MPNLCKICISICVYSTHFQIGPHQISSNFIINTCIHNHPPICEYILLIHRLYPPQTKYIHTTHNSYTYMCRERSCMHVLHARV